MKQVRFGSFPLAEILPKEKDCLDKYLIKHFADNISFKDTITNLSVTKNTFYVGPTEIVKDLLKSRTGTGSGESFKFGDINSNTSHPANMKYLEVQKRAFNVISNFYFKLSDAPFYKGMTYYPIYIEKVEKSFTPISGKDIDQKFNYSFILLTNDLIHNKERKVDEAGVINFLYIYLHLFHSPFLLNEDLKYSVDSTTGLSSISKEHVVQVMKFYKLIQTYDLNPVKVFMSIYELIKVAKDFSMDFGNSNTSDRKFNTQLGNTLKNKMDKFNNPLFKNMLDKVIQEVTDLFHRNLIGGSRLSKEESLKHSNIMLHIINLVLKDKEIHDFVDNLQEGRFSRDSRMQAVADFHHYSNIINNFNELVAYNELGIQDIIKDMDVNFDKDLVIDNEDDSDLADQVSRLTGIIDRNNFDTAFSKFVMDFKTYSEIIIQKELSPVVSKLRHNHMNSVSGSDQIRSLGNSIKNHENQLRDFDITIGSLTQEKSFILSVSTNGTLGTREADRYQEIEQELINIKTQKNETIRLMQEDNAQLIIVNQQRDLALEKNEFKLPRLDNTSDLFNKIDESIGFIYGDLESLFMNPMVLQEMLSGKNYSYDSIPSNAQDLNNIFLSTPRTNDEMINSLYRQLYEDIQHTSEVLMNEIHNQVELLGGNITDIGSELSKEHIQANIIKSLGLRFFAVMKKYLRNISTKTNRILQYKSSLQGIHPMLGKMSKDPSNFKSFILSTNILSALYDLIFITQEKMFLSGLLKRPPRKLNNADAKSEFIVNNILGLQNNPTWVVGENKIRLLLPDYLALTGSQIVSEIPKAKLKQICNMDLKNWWKQNAMGTLNKLEGKNPELIKVNDELKALRAELSKTDREDKSTYQRIQLQIQDKDKEKLKIASHNPQDNTLGNVGMTFTSGGLSNYETLRSKAGFDKQSTPEEQERYDQLTPEEQAETKDPRRNDINSGFDDGINKDLIQQTQTQPLGGRFDDVHEDLMRKRLMDRAVFNRS